MKRLIYLLIFLSLVLPNDSFAMENEPTEFRGIKFGTDISKLTGMKKSLSGRDRNSYIQDYNKEHDKMSIGTAHIKYVMYTFYKNQFFMVTILFAGQANFNKLKTTLIEAYGFPKKSSDRLCEWDGINTDVSIWMSRDNTGSIWYRYKTIFNELEKEQKEKNKKEAQKGVKDL